MVWYTCCIGKIFAFATIRSLDESCYCCSLRCKSTFLQQSGVGSSMQPEIVMFWLSSFFWYCLLSIVFSCWNGLEWTRMAMAAIANQLVSSKKMCSKITSVHEISLTIHSYLWDIWYIYHVYLIIKYIYEASMQVSWVFESSDTVAVPWSSFSLKHQGSDVFGRNHQETSKCPWF